MISSINSRVYDISGNCLWFLNKPDMSRLLAKKIGCMVNTGLKNSWKEDIAAEL